MPPEVPLLGGTANAGRVHRVGDTVRRPLRPTAPAVHALLRHLESVGFSGAPRVIGVDDTGREVLAYVHGEAVIAPAPGWGLTDAALHSVGVLMRRFHEATAGFDAAPHTWPTSAPAPFEGGVITHNDPNLDNVVFRGGRAVALIDFDLAGPGDPVWDIAGAARMWAPLRDPVDVDDARRGRHLVRLRVLADAYRLDAARRALLAEAVLVHHHWMCDLIADGARHGEPGFTRYWTATAQSRALRTGRWLARHRGAITAALLDGT